MVTILARITVAPGRESEFERIAADLFRDSHANEPALLRYEYWRGAAPGQYVTLLAFEDHDGFIAHQVSAHHVAAADLIRPLTTDIHLEWLDPVPGASLLPRTVASRPIPADVDDVERSYRTRQPVEIAEWWSKV